MHVRASQPSDHRELLRLGSRFFATSPHTAATIESHQVVSLVASVLEHGHCVVMEHGKRLVGMLGFLVGPHPISRIPTAFEVAWFVEEDSRGSRGSVQLVREAEAVAKGAGARQLQIGAPDDRVGSFLNRLGFHAAETTYVRPL